MHDGSKERQNGYLTFLKFYCIIVLNIFMKRVTRFMGKRMEKVGQEKAVRDKIEIEFF